ncbi:MAG: carboxypeptidase-like regulatory domain-containing protein, partial [Bacteroidales bacterium]|nr:carboxypeptidase-like regulatory domain-containing protein [Bacteroidales bacterium]
MVGFLLTASANSYSQNTRMTINLKNGTVTELMKFVEDNSEFVFLYKNDDLDLKKKVTVELENATIQQVLDAGFAGQHVGYDVYDRQIIIYKALAIRVPAESVQQQRTVTGVVTDQSGQPLPGVTVVVTGTTQGTVTNSDGNFSLTIPDGAETLQFSFVGMRTQEVPIDGRTTFTVVMEEETIGIEEVVAIGYGTMKKSHIT